MGLTRDGPGLRFDDPTRLSRPHTASIDRDFAFAAVRSRNSAAAALSRHNDQPNRHERVGGVSGWVEWG